MDFYANKARHLLVLGNVNWDIYANSDMTASYSIAKTSNCKSSYFGDKYHIKNLLVNGHLDYTGFTDKGIEFLSGLYCKKITPDNGKSFILTSFN